MTITTVFVNVLREEGVNMRNILVRAGGVLCVLICTTSVMQAASAGQHYDDWKPVGIETPFGMVPSDAARFFCAAETSFLGEVQTVTPVQVHHPSVPDYVSVDVKVGIAYQGTTVGSVETVLAPIWEGPLASVSPGDDIVLALQTIVPQPDSWPKGARFVAVAVVVPPGTAIPSSSTAIAAAGDLCNALEW